MKKGFSQFIFEFIMLFLAITAGFFVENLREDYSEQKQEKALIKTMVEDLKIDIENLQRITTIRNTRRLMLDSLTLLMNSGNPDKYTNLIYVQAKKVSRFLEFTYISLDRTYEQLKNANGFRLIENQKVAERISKYYEQVKLVNQLEDQENFFVQLYLPICYQIFDGLVFDKIIDEDGRLQKLPSHVNPSLLKTYANQLSTFNGNLNNIKAVNKKVIADEKKLILQGEALIDFIKDEYNYE
ncbi:MAG: hypothetical protein QM734_00365 [Cyclobacteriaceae bacterium]